MPGYYGWHQPKQVWAFVQRHEYTHADLEALPAKVDLDDPYPQPSPFDPAVDQLGIGACGPNCMAEMLAYEFQQAGMPQPLASRLAMYYAVRQAMGTLNQDSGVDNQTMCDVIAAQGWPDEKLCPYNIADFRVPPSQAAYDQTKTRQGWVKALRVGQNVDAMRSAIAAKHPIVAGFTVYSSFESQTVSRSGEVPLPRRGEQILGGHDNIIIGYDDTDVQWKTRNPWGPNFGDKGNLYFHYSHLLDPSLASDFWIMVPTVAPPKPPPIPQPNPEPIPVGGARSIYYAPGTFKSGETGSYKCQ